MMMRRSVAAGLAATTVAFAAMPAGAADSYGDWVSGEISVELQNDHLFGARGVSQSNDLYTTTEFQGVLHLTPHLQVQLGLTLEPVEDLEPGENRWFGDHGLYADTLQIVYEADDWYLHAGKFTAAFGIDPDFLPGIFGDTFSANYELTERLGFGGGFEYAVEDFAEIEMKAAAFKRDTTVLSGSLITSRPRLHLSDSGPANTEAPESFSAAVDFKNIDVAPRFAVHTSVLYQSAGDADPSGQWAFSIGGVYEGAIGEVQVTPVIDYVRSYDALNVGAPTSVEGARENYLTAGVLSEWEEWSGAVVGGFRWDSQPGVGDSRDSFAQVSAGYNFTPELGLQVGWLYLDEGGVEQQGVGALLAYVASF